MDALSLDAGLVSVFMLVLARVGGWAMITPLFGARATTRTGRAVFAAAMALVLTAPAAVTADVPADLAGFIQAVIVQFLFGAAFAFVTGLLLYAPMIAGSIADLMSGLAYASVVDPASGDQSAVFSRLFSITFIALLFATDAYLTIIYGFALTFEAVPIGATVPFDPSAVGILSEGMAMLMRAAVEVAAPLMGVLMLTEVALGIASRFFPQANVAFLGLGLKALIALAAAGAVLILLPSRIDSLIAGGADLARAVFS